MAVFSDEPAEAARSGDAELLAALNGVIGRNILRPADPRIAADPKKREREREREKKKKKLFFATLSPHINRHRNPKSLNPLPSCTILAATPRCHVRRYIIDQ
jgi:hypothetical protein